LMILAVTLRNTMIRDSKQSVIFYTGQLIDNNWQGGQGHSREVDRQSPRELD